MNLFEIDAEIKACVKLQDSEDYVNVETGEIIGTEELDRLEMSRDRKIRNIACWIIDLEAQADALKAQRNKFAERAQAALNKRNQLAAYLQNFLQGEKWENDEVKITYRKSEAVYLAPNLDVTTLPEACYNIKYNANKTIIKELLKAKQDLPGCQIVSKNNMIVR